MTPTERTHTRSTLRLVLWGGGGAVVALAVSTLLLGLVVGWAGGQIAEGFVLGVALAAPLIVLITPMALLVVGLSLMLLRLVGADLMTASAASVLIGSAAMGLLGALGVWLLSDRSLELWWTLAGAASGAVGGLCIVRVRRRSPG